MKQHKMLLLILLTLLLAAGLAIVMTLAKPSPNPKYVTLLNKVRQSGNLAIIAEFKVDPALMSTAKASGSVDFEEIAIQHTRTQLLNKSSLRTAKVLAQSENWVIPVCAACIRIRIVLQLQGAGDRCVGASRRGGVRRCIGRSRSWGIG